MLTVDVPVLATVRFRVELLPIETLPKLRVLGLALRVPVPGSGWVDLALV